MKKSIILVMLMFMWPICLNAADSDDTTWRNSWGDSLRQSHFHPGIALQTKYVWRGMEMMTDDAAPVLFPSLGYDWRGLYAYVTGGYAINGEYAEVDCGVSYTIGALQIGVNDYYYPRVDGPDDRYVHTGPGNGHWLEAQVAYNPESIPLHVLASTFLAGGADRYTDGATVKRAYSTYVEVGTYYTFTGDQRIALNVGAACNRSCYNGYRHGFCVCDIDLAYTYPMTLGNGWQLPLGVTVIYNPDRNKPFVNFSISLCL